MLKDRAASGNRLPLAVLCSSQASVLLLCETGIAADSSTTVQRVSDAEMHPSLGFWRRVPEAASCQSLRDMSEITIKRRAVQSLENLIYMHYFVFFSF